MTAKHPYKAYAAATLTVARTTQVVMLYDAAIRFVQQAKEAIERKDIETRFKTITKAANIIFGLQGCLDFEQGGEVAKTLYGFYSSIDARLLSIHRTNSIETCDQVIKELKMMRDAWAEIDEKAADGEVPAPPAKPPAVSGAKRPAPAAPPAAVSGTPDSGGVAISA